MGGYSLPTKYAPSLSEGYRTSNRSQSYPLMPHPKCMTTLQRNVLVWPTIASLYFQSAHGSLTAYAPCIAHSQKHPNFSWLIKSGYVHHKPMLVRIQHLLVNT